MTRASGNFGDWRFSNLASFVEGVCNALKSGHQLTPTGATKASMRHCNAHPSSSDAQRPEICEVTRQNFCGIEQPRRDPFEATDLELTHVHRYTIVHAVCRRCFPLHTRPLPSIAAAEHALLECSGIGETSNVTGLTVAEIERSL